MRSKVLWVLLFLLGPWSSTAAADNRFVVRAPAGSAALQQLCLTLGCNVAGGLDGAVGTLFLVTVPSFVGTYAFLPRQLFAFRTRNRPMGSQALESWRSLTQV